VGSAGEAPGEPGAGAEFSPPADVEEPASALGCVPGCAPAGPLSMDAAGEAGFAPVPFGVPGAEAVVFAAPPAPLRGQSSTSAEKNPPTTTSTTTTSTATAMRSRLRDWRSS